jgi:predicted amidohydrolase
MLQYKALALQVACKAINNFKHPDDAHAAMRENVEIVSKRIGASKAFIGKDLKLVVLPEYFISGFPMHESVEGWKAKACINDAAPVMAAIREIAVKHGVFLAGNVYENDLNFPEIYFQLCFILDPLGNTILKYRRLNSMFSFTPYDVLDRYIEMYGQDALFPVVDTEIGRLACVASEEILYPEICRCLMMNGAEVILHPTSEVASPLATPKNIAKQARAIENLAYLVSANSAGILQTDFPAYSTDGSSKIIRYDGLILAEAASGESMAANAIIDIGALRHYRQLPGMGNLISRQRNRLFADMYAKREFYPANTWQEGFQKTDFIHIQRQVIEKYFSNPQS